MVFGLIGMCSVLFALDFSQVFTQAADQTDDVSSMFERDTAVHSIYKQALKLAKDNEVVSSNAAFKQLESYYTDCYGVLRKDFINILLDSNVSFAAVFAGILPGILPHNEDIDLIFDLKKKEIDISYKKFMVCKKMISKTTLAATSDMYDTISNEINKLYYEAYINSYTIKTINQANYGSDIYRNGTLDDSDFDILYDINQVGKILFENFKETEQILFYRMPEIDQNLTQGWGDLSSLDDQSSYQAWGWWYPGTTSYTSQWSSSVWWVWVSSDLSSDQQRNSYDPSLSSQVQRDSDTVSDTTLGVTDDPEIQKFISTTNVSSSPSSPLLFGNQCLVSESVAQSIEEEPVFQDPEKYIEEINDFIDNANVNDTINEILIENYHKDNPLPPGGSTSDPGYAERVANTYAEQVFGDAAPGSCEYGCNGMNIAEQTQCKLACAKSCTQQCNDTRKQGMTSCTTIFAQDKDTCNTLSSLKKTACFVKASSKLTACLNTTVTDELLCVNQCTCFMIAWPNGAWWQKMEEMFRIKFCTIPVQKTTTVNKVTNVNSIQAIFQVMYDVLTNLRDSGQTIKKFKTKEFLDGTTKINFADTFAFKLQVNFKPVFPKKSNATKEKEQKNKNAEYQTALMDINPANPESDNQNKYVIISDTIANSVLKEPISVYEDIAVLTEKTQQAEQLKTQSKLPVSDIDVLIKDMVADTPAMFVINMLSFLQDNQIFWQNMSETLQSMNKMSLELKTKIQKSK